MMFVTFKAPGGSIKAFSSLLARNSAIQMTIKSEIKSFLYSQEIRKVYWTRWFTLELSLKIKNELN